MDRIILSPKDRITRESQARRIEWVTEQGLDPNKVAYMTVVPDTMHAWVGEHRHDVNGSQIVCQHNTVLHTERRVEITSLPPVAEPCPHRRTTTISPVRAKSLRQICHDCGQGSDDVSALWDFVADRLRADRSRLDKEGASEASIKSLEARQEELRRATSGLACDDVHPGTHPDCIGGHRDIAALLRLARPYSDHYGYQDWWGDF